ncbi:MAG: hypothetical protein ACTH93_03365 [Pseudoclavibacter sp.]
MGVSQSRLRANDLEQPYRGVRCARREMRTAESAQNQAGSPSETPKSKRLYTAVTHRARQYLPLMKPGLAFSHQTAAIIWGLPLPLSMIASTLEPDGLDVAAAATLSRPRHRGIRSRRMPSTAHVYALGDLPVCDVRTTWMMLADVPNHSDADLVAVGDFLVCRAELRADGRQPFAGPRELIEWAGSLSGRNCRRMRQVARLVRDGSQSPMESLTRLLLLEAGLPEPELNADIYDRAGGHLARADLLYRVQRVIPEFDGDQHRTSRAQHTRDRERLKALRNEGYEVVQADLRTLTDACAGQEFVAEVERALVQRGTRW